MAINNTQGISTEIVLQERVTTTEFRILEIHESIQDRVVRVDVELGPFETVQRPDGGINTRGRGRRGITVWHNEEYDAIRDTWTNADLINVVKSKLVS